MKKTYIFIKKIVFLSLITLFVFAFTFLFGNNVYAKEVEMDSNIINPISIREDASSSRIANAYKVVGRIGEKASEKLFGRTVFRATLADAVSSEGSGSGGGLEDDSNSRVFYASNVKDRVDAIAADITVISDLIAAIVRDGGNMDIEKHILDFTRAAINTGIALGTDLPGATVIAGAVFDGIENIFKASDGTRQSETQLLMNYITDQVQLVRDDISKTRVEIAELAEQVSDSTNQILEALTESFEDYTAKTKVNDFLSTTSGNFSYERYKKYIYSNGSDGFALELTEEALKEKQDEARIKQISDSLYKAIMSYNGANQASNLEMLYDSIMESDTRLSIFEYFVNYLNSNQSYVEEDSMIAGLNFMYDVYQTFLQSVYYVHSINLRQISEILLSIGDDDIDTRDIFSDDNNKYIYGAGENDFNTLRRIKEIEDRLSEMVFNVNGQVAKDLAYILELNKCYYFTALDGKSHLAYNTNKDTFGNIQNKYKIEFLEIEHSALELFGLRADNFDYYVYDQNNNQLNAGKEKDKFYTLDNTSVNKLKLVVRYTEHDENHNIKTQTIKDEYGVAKDKPITYDIYSIDFNVGVTNNFDGGSGTLDDPYHIGNVSQFKLMASANRANAYILINDLSIGSINQLFNDIAPFEGYFDGDGHTLSNITVNASQNNTSLFGVIGSSGVVANTIFSSISITKDNDNDSSSLQVGGIAGTNNGKIYNCEVKSSTIKASRNSDERSGNINRAIYLYIGGAVGQNNGTVQYVKVRGTTVEGVSKRYYAGNDDGINGNYVYAGGVIGYNGGSATVSQVGVDTSINVKSDINCSMKVHLSTRHPYGDSYAGGIIGKINSSSNITSLYYSSGTITATEDHKNKAWSGGSNAHNIETKKDGYVANWSVPSEKKASTLEQSPASVSYQAELLLDGDVDNTYKINENIILNPGTSNLILPNLNINVTSNNKTTNYSNIAILNIKNYDCWNPSHTADVKRKANISVIVFEIDRVFEFEVEYVIKANTKSSISIDKITKRFAYDDDAANNIVDGYAKEALDVNAYIHYLDKTYVMLDGKAATTSIDFTKIGRQDITIKAEGLETQASIYIECKEHDFSGVKLEIQGHTSKTLDNGTVIYTVYGYQDTVCSRCGYENLIPYSSDVETELQNQVDPTCSSYGYTGDLVAFRYDTNQQKEYLDYIIEHGSYIDMLAHTYLDDSEAHYDDVVHKCNVCGHAEEHLYNIIENDGELSSGLVFRCSICNHVEIKNKITKEEIEKIPRIVVNDAYVLEGKQQITVYIDLHASVGITSANFTVKFDSHLKLINYRLGNILNDAAIGNVKIYDDHINVVLAQGGADNSTDGTILKLIFETPEDCESGEAITRYKISVVNKANSDKFTDKNGKKTDFIAYDGYIIVVDHLPGDVNDDGKIDLLDAVLISDYVVLDENEKAGYASRMQKTNEKFTLGYADVNLDGVIDTDDIVRIMRYCSGGYESQLTHHIFSIDLNYNDGSGRVETFFVNYNFGKGKFGDLMSLPVIEKAGYKFDGWFYELDGSGVQVTDDLLVIYNQEQYMQTLYAHFTLNEISFDGNEGVGEKPTLSIYTDEAFKNFSNTSRGIDYFTRKSEVILEMNEADVANYEKLFVHDFLGWSYTPDGEVIPENELPDINSSGVNGIGKITLYAVWSKLHIPANIPEYIGMEFLGWAKNKNSAKEDIVWDGKGEYETPGAITLYAQWHRISFYIEYNANGIITASGNQTYREEQLRDGGITKNLVALEATSLGNWGYDFIGWTVDKNLADNWDPSKLTGEELLYVDSASLLKTLEPSTSLHRNDNGLITAGYETDLIKYKDENGVVTLYGIFVPHKFKIAFYAYKEQPVINENKVTPLLVSDNSAVDPATPIVMEYEYGSKITMPDLYKNNGDYFRFKAWIDEFDNEKSITDVGDDLDISLMPQEDGATINYYGVWERNKFKLQYSFAGPDTVVHDLFAIDVYRDKEFTVISTFTYNDKEYTIDYPLEVFDKHQDLYRYDPPFISPNNYHAGFSYTFAYYEDVYVVFFSKLDEY